MGKRHKGEPVTGWNATGGIYAMAERICYLSHEQVGAILGARRVADGNSNEEENLRIGLKLLRESAQLQMDVAETALQKLDEATKPRLVPS